MRRAYDQSVKGCGSVRETCSYIIVEHGRNLHIVVFVVSSYIIYLFMLNVVVNYVICNRVVKSE